MKIKQQKGVTLIILAVTITVMLILLGTIASQLKGTKDIEKYANMQADIIRINEKINTYYIQNGILPVRNKYNDVQMLKNIKNPNDNENYYVIDLSKIELNELELGIKGFLDVRKINIDIPIEQSHGIRDVYIINEQSHTVYYPQGISIDNVTSYSLLDDYTKQEDVSYVPEKITIEDAKDTGKEFTDDKTEVEDSKGNKVVIPGGFIVAPDSGNTVQQGIVIEDVSASGDDNVKGSQFVWIPVGTFVKDDGSTSNEIVLGRYTFNETNGTPTLVQAAYTTDNPENYKQEIGIDKSGYQFKELPNYREGVASSGLDGLNATAKDLARFVESTKTNGGYYIARYEASFASGTDIGSYKAASKKSTANSESGMNYITGTLWNFITELEASKVSINTYSKSKTAKSDLINSYAWDTAIVFIQEAGHKNYANQSSKNISLSNTGTTGDEVCKINDMSSNIREWTTEYSTRTSSSDAYTCISRGGIYNYSNFYTAIRDYNVATGSNNNYGFRFTLYM